MYQNILKRIFAKFTFDKFDSANLDGVHKSLQPKSLSLAWKFAFGETRLFITSGRDSKHSKNSLHYEGKAIDVRIWTFDGVYVTKRSIAWWGQLENACFVFAEILGPKYSIVLEKHHIHVQLGTRNIRTPDKGLGKHKNLWITRGGREYAS